MITRTTKTLIEQAQDIHNTSMLEMPIQHLPAMLDPKIRALKATLAELEATLAATVHGNICVPPKF